MRQKLQCFLLGLACISLQSGRTVSCQAKEGKQTDSYQAIWLPRARAEASRKVYSQIFESLERRDHSIAPGFWVVPDISLRMADPEVPCKLVHHDQLLQGSDWLAHTLNPHEAVKAPADRERDLRELLDDFDRHCHDLIEFDASDFETAFHVYLLNEQDQKGAPQPRDGPPLLDPNTVWVPVLPKPQSEIVKAQGYARVGEVFFNRRHTVAMVLTQAGSIFWTVLELRGGVWQPVRWRTLTLNF